MSLEKSTIITVHIDWEGPFSLSAIRLRDVLNDETKDYGVYQVYAAHQLYGANCLAYIGKAQEQTFATRITQEDWSFNCDAQLVQIYAGRLIGRASQPRPNLDEWSRMISLAEKLLIHAHSPVWNGSNKNSIPKELESIHIYNWSNHRALMPEVSGGRYVGAHFEEKDWPHFTMKKEELP